MKLDSRASFPDFDVAVIGAGPGGVSAALSAARAGAKTVLVERFGCFGGTWTSGILSAIMPFPYVRGIFTEVIERLKNKGGWVQFAHIEPNMAASDLGNDWAGGSYDSELLKAVLDEMILEAGVTPLFFAQLSAVNVADGRVQSVQVLTKEGFLTIRAKMWVDGSGDGDLCAWAGVPFEVGREEDGAVQPMTMIFKMNGVDDQKATDFRKNQGKTVLNVRWKEAQQKGEITIKREGLLFHPLPRAGQWHFNTTRVLGKDATKALDVSEAMIEGRRQVREIEAFMRKSMPGFENAYVLETASHIGVRESRRILGDYTMTQDDITRPAEFTDAIARGNWFVDIHNPNGAGTQHIHAPKGRFYEIPYRSLCPRGLNNTLVASRCIDTTHEAHAAVRITPQVSAIGQAAGMAAALAVAAGHEDIRKLDVNTLRGELRGAGAFI